MLHCVILCIVIIFIALLANGIVIIIQYLALFIFEILPLNNLLYLLPAVLQLLSPLLFGRGSLYIFPSLTQAVCANGSVQVIAQAPFPLQGDPSAIYLKYPLFPLHIWVSLFHTLFNFPQNIHYVINLLFCKECFFFIIYPWLWKCKFL